MISVLERASFTVDAPLRGHCRAIQNTATAAVVLDALMLNDGLSQIASAPRVQVYRAVASGDLIMSNRMPRIFWLMTRPTPLM